MSTRQNNVAVKAEHISKKYCKSLKKSMLYGIKDIGRNMLGLSSHPAELRKSEFWAVDDVSFELKKGEVLGIIGLNGAGKTTLLKMLNGIFWPDKGKIAIKGRVAALIAVGAGFHPLLTGRENVYINAAILGMTKKEVDEKFVDMIEFADIGDFLDAPVKFYSSGMYVRLGFSIAVYCKPDILLIDEVLAVGDALFRNKCYNEIGRLRKNSAVVFVSHNMSHISQICDKVCVLSQGKIIYFGSMAEGIGIYEEENRKVGQNQETQGFESIIPPVENIEFIFDRLNLNHGDNLRLNVKISLSSDVINATFRFVLYDEMEVPCAEWNNRRLGFPINLKKGLNELSMDIGPMTFKAGNYKIGITFHDESGASMLLWSFKKYALNISSFTSVGPTVAFGRGRFDLKTYNQ